VDLVDSQVSVVNLDPLDLQGNPDLQGLGENLAPEDLLVKEGKLVLLVIEESLVSQDPLGPQDLLDLVDSQVQVGLVVNLDFEEKQGHQDHQVLPGHLEVVGREERLDHLVLLDNLASQVPVEKMDSKGPLVVEERVDCQVQLDHLGLLDLQVREVQLVPLDLQDLLVHVDHQDHLDFQESREVKVWPETRVLWDQQVQQDPRDLRDLQGRMADLDLLELKEKWVKWAHLDLQAILVLVAHRDHVVKLGL